MLKRATQKLAEMEEEKEITMTFLCVSLSLPLPALPGKEDTEPFCFDKKTSVESFWVVELIWP